MTILLSIGVKGSFPPKILQSSEFLVSKKCENGAQLFRASRRNNVWECFLNPLNTPRNESKCHQKVGGGRGGDLSFLYFVRELKLSVFDLQTLRLCTV